MNLIEVFKEFGKAVCSYCGYQIHPLANTIFHKSSANLKNWFYAMFLFSCSKNGVSAKELPQQQK